MIFSSRKSSGNIPCLQNTPLMLLFDDVKHSQANIYQNDTHVATLPNDVSSYFDTVIQTVSLITGR